MDLIDNFGPSLIGTAIGSAVAASIVQLFGKKVIGFRPRFIPTYFAALTGSVSGAIIGCVIALFLARADVAVDGAVMVLTGIICFFAQAGFYVLFLHKADGSGITYGRACLISLVQLAVGGILMVLIFLFYLRRL